MHFKLLEARRERFREKLPEAIKAFAHYYGLDPASLPSAELLFRDITLAEVKGVIRRTSGWTIRMNMPSDLTLKLMLVSSKLLGGSGIAYHTFSTRNIYIPGLSSQLFLPDYALIPILAHEYAHVVQECTRVSRLKYLSRSCGTIYTAAVEGLASRLNTTLMDEINEQGKLTTNDKILAIVYRYSLRLSNFIFAPLYTIQSFMQKIIRTFISDQTVAKLVDNYPRLFSFLINPYKDGNEFVARVEEKIGNRREAFDLITYQPPGRASDLFNPEGYVDFWLADVRARLERETGDTVLSKGRIQF